MNWLCPDLLGSKEQFKLKYSDPITKGLSPSASAEEKSCGATASLDLQKQIAPYVLRRTKGQLGLMGKAIKVDFVVWVKLDRPQVDFHNRFNSDPVLAQQLNPSKKHLPALGVLKVSICSFAPFCFLLFFSEHFGFHPSVRNESHRR